MFSNNQKISARQLRALLWMDLAAKMALVLPRFLAGLQLWQQLAGIGAGSLLAGLFLRLSLSVCCRQQKSGKAYFHWVRQQLGPLGVIVLALACELYLLLASVLMLLLCIWVTQVQLLPETPGWELWILPTVVGLYLAKSGMEVRGRVAELLRPVVLAGFLLLLLLALPEVQWSRFANLPAPSLQGLPGSGIGTGMILAAFGGIAILPLNESVAWQYHASGRMAGRALRQMFLLVLFTVVVCFGVFGTAGMQGQEWPVIALMSSVVLPGGILQRFDVILILFLLLGLFVSAAGGMYYTGALHAQLGLPAWSGWILPPLLSLLLLYSGWEKGTLLRWYQRLNIYCCVPVLLFGVILLYLLNNRRQGKLIQWISLKRAGLVLLILMALYLLTGCQARELETRRFPLVLELGEQEGRLQLTCAWPSDSPETGSDGEKNNKAGEAENRSISHAAGSNLEEAMLHIQEEQERYVDYSQVKAILWDETLREAPKLEAGVKDYLKRTPVFARNILIFPKNESELPLQQIQEQTGCQASIYLENLRRNSTRWSREASTLQALLYP